MINIAKSAECVVWGQSASCHVYQTGRKMLVDATWRWAYSSQEHLGRRLDSM